VIVRTSAVKSVQTLMATGFIGFILLERRVQLGLRQLPNSLNAS
jgi:hypothetical protein